jgi:hypothetical protein
MLMSVQDIAEAVMQLPGEGSPGIGQPASWLVWLPIKKAPAQAVRGIEDVITGKVRRLNEAEFREALQ